MVIAELETSKGNRSPARFPSWIGEEVSNDDRYSNANLVEHPYSEWRPGSEKPDPKYHWKAGEGVADGLKSIIAEPLQLAIWELSADLWRLTLRRAKVPYFRIYDLRSTYATRLSAGGVADVWVTQLLRQGDAKEFEKYSQMKLQMKREALKKLNRKANEGQAGFDTDRPH